MKVKTQDLVKIQNKTAIMQILGCILQNPSYLTDSNYSILPDDFAEKFHSILFSAMNNLYISETKVLDVPAICDYLIKFPSQYNVFDVNGGVDYIETVREIGEQENFDYNYKVLKKFTVLRDLAQNGVDITDLYDYKETDPKKIEKMNEELDQKSAEDIINHYMSKLNDVSTKFSMSNSDLKKVNVSSSVRNIIDSFKEKPDVGARLYNAWYNTAFRGARTSKFYLESASSGCVDKDTEFFTGTRWKPISEYQEGDKVLQYNLDGTVDLVYPERYIKVPCEEFNYIKTKYGLDQMICDEHNMVVRNCSRQRKLVKIPFKEFKERHEASKNGLGLAIPTAFNYTLGKGIDLTDAQIRLMVAVIADGSFREDCRPTWCRVNLKKQRKKERLVELLNDCGIEYISRDREDGYTVYKFDAPRSEKVFSDYWYGCSKHQMGIIAEEVLLWDGSKRGKRMSFSTTIKENADFVQFVFSGLEKRTTISINDRVGREYLTCGKVYTRKSVEYTVIISSHSHFVSMQNSNGEKTPIERVPSVDGYKYCFTVDSGMLVLRRNNKVFVTGNCGKTRRQLREATYLAMPYLYDTKTKEWVKSPFTPKKTVYIGTELEEDEVLPIMVAFLTGINEEKIKMNELNEEECLLVEQAISMLENNDNINIVLISDFDVDDIEKIIVDEILKNNCKYIFMDYLHSTPKSLSYYARKTGVKGLQEHQSLFLMSVKLKAICNKYKVFLWSSTQVNSEGMGSESPRNEQCLRGAKAIADKIDSGTVISRVTPKDIESLKEVIINNYGKKPTHCLSIYKNRGGRLRGVYLWSIFDLGTMREEFLYATTNNYEPIEVKILEIEEEIEEENETCVDLSDENMQEAIF